LVDAQVIAFPEMNFSPAFIGAEFIALDNRKIHRSFFISHILGSLEIHIAFDIAQSDKGAGIIFFLGIGES
jgi:hypothetical protein